MTRRGVTHSLSSPLGMYSLFSLPFQFLFRKRVERRETGYDGGVEKGIIVPFRPGGGWKTETRGTTPLLGREIRVIGVPGYLARSSTTLGRDFRREFLSFLSSSFSDSSVRREKISIAIRSDRYLLARLLACLLTRHDRRVTRVNRDVFGKKVWKFNDYIRYSRVIPS